MTNRTDATAALYARYSSDLQSDSSIDDQLRLCRERAAREGWRVAHEYVDHAISGATLFRPGMQSLLAAAAAGSVTLILTEALDRLSRDQEDTAHLFKRLSFLGVKIFTLEEGEISELHVGLKGTMNALYLKSLGEKSRRGMRGVVEQGRAAGGISYGYQPRRRRDERGDEVAGERDIMPDQAEVIRRIFREYAAGRSAFEIVKDLNAEAVPGPRGGPWNASTLLGNRKRGNGLLNNELYVGRLVWNRQRFVKDPDTGKRQARPNPPEKWISRPVPDLRIVDQDLWERAQARLKQMGSVHRPEQARRPKHLFSGMLTCKACGGSYSVVHANRLGCSTSRNTGSCDNRRMIRVEVLEDRILTGLTDMLFSPEAKGDFMDEYRKGAERRRIDDQAGRREKQRELTSLPGKKARYLAALETGAGDVSSIVAGLRAIEERERALLSDPESAERPFVELHANAPEIYRRQVARLRETLAAADPADRRQAIELLRQLVSEIKIGPGAAAAAPVELELFGDADAILALTSPERTRPERAGRSGPVTMVAGVGFEPTTFRL